MATRHQLTSSCSASSIHVLHTLSLRLLGCAQTFWAIMACRCLLAPCSYFSCDDTQSHVVLLQVLHQNLDLGRLQEFARRCLTDHTRSSQSHRTDEAAAAAPSSSPSQLLAASHVQQDKCHSQPPAEVSKDGSTAVTSHLAHCEDVHGAWRLHLQHRLPLAALQDAQEFLLSILAEPCT